MPVLSKQAVVGSLIAESNGLSDQRITVAQAKSIRRHAERAALRGSQVSPDLQRYVGYDRVHQDLFGKDGVLRGAPILYRPDHAGAHITKFIIPGLGPTAFHEFGHGIDLRERDASFFGDDDDPKMTKKLNSEASASRKAIAMLRKAHRVDEITDPTAKKRALDKVYAGAAELAAYFDTYADSARFEQRRGPAGLALGGAPAALLVRMRDILDKPDDVVKTKMQVSPLIGNSALVLRSRDRRIKALKELNGQWNSLGSAENSGVRLTDQALKKLVDQRKFVVPDWHHSLAANNARYLPGLDSAESRIRDAVYANNRKKLALFTAELYPVHANTIRDEVRRYIQQSGEYLGRDAKRGVIRDLIKLRNEVRPLVPALQPANLPVRPEYATQAPKAPSVLSRLRRMVFGATKV